MSEAEKKKQQANLDAMLRLMWGEAIPYHDSLAKIVWLYVDILDVLGQGRENNLPLEQVKKWLDNSRCSVNITTTFLDNRFNYTVNERRCSLFDAPAAIVRDKGNWRELYFWWDSQTSSVDSPTTMRYSDNKIRKCMWKKNTENGFVVYRPGDKPAQIEIDVGGVVQMEWHDKDGNVARSSRPWLSVFKYRRHPKQDGQWIKYSAERYELDTVIWSPSEKAKGLFVDGMTFEQSVDKWIQPELDKLLTYVPRAIRENEAWAMGGVVSLVHLMFGWLQPRSAK